MRAKKRKIDDLPYVRDLDAGLFFEIFFVSAILSVLGIRFLLFATGYPQLSPGELHIAHMLWGGLLMMVAIVMLLGFVGRTVKYVASGVAGIGFGAFIDELGKFITRDNDYWFQPTVALIYVVFILIYLAFRYIHRHKVTSREYLVNGLVMIQEAILADMDEEEKAQAVDYLSHGDHRKNLIRELESYVEGKPADSSSKFTPYKWLKGLARRIYHRLIAIPHFSSAVILFFVVDSLFWLVRSIMRVGLVVAGPVLVLLVMFIVAVFWRRYKITRRFSRAFLLSAAGFVVYLIVRKIILGVEYPTLLFAEWGQLISSLIVGVYVVIGVYRFYRSRVVAYRYFKTAVLVTIFLTQFFEFYLNRFMALPGLITNILVLFILDYMIVQEKYLKQLKSGSEAQAAKNTK